MENAGPPSTTRAPVGLMFTLHRTLQAGSYLDLGMFMQNVMVAARGYELLQQGVRDGLDLEASARVS